jgi:PAS domain S-box-containing protein
MTLPNDPPEPPADPSGQGPSEAQVGDLLSSAEMAKAAENEDFKRFLDHVPIAILIARGAEDAQRIVYANAAFEVLSGQAAVDLEGRTWAILESFVHEDDPALDLSRAVAQGEDFLGTFRTEWPEGKPVLVQAYASAIEPENDGEGYRIAALVDVTDRERSQREELEKEIRNKDLLLKELQHRVKNNLQLVTALIRLEARAAKRGDKVDLDRLAGRIDTLSLLYQTLSTDHWGPVVDLGPYLGEIASASARAHAIEGVALDLKMSYCPVSINVAMPVGLLINELLMNSFKYAFAGRDKGTISIACECEDGRHRLVYADDGVGLPVGMGWPTQGKLGALIVQTLRENTRQLRFEVVSDPGQGMGATIEFLYSPPVHKAS